MSNTLDNLILQKIWCETENTWKYQYSDTVLDQCPTDAEHDVNAQSPAEVDMLKKKYEFNSLVIDDPEWGSLGSAALDFPGLNSYTGEIAEIKIMAWAGKNVDTFQVRIFDTTNSIIVATSQLLDNHDKQTIYIDYADISEFVLSDDPAVWELHGKQTLTDANLLPQPDYADDAAYISELEILFVPFGIGNQL